MNAFEFSRKIETLTPEIIREMGVESVWLNESLIKKDLANANDSGLTFSGNPIAKNEFSKFSDWIETGIFRANLKFIEDDIEMTSNGSGYDAIVAAYDEDDYIAPTAKVLDSSTMKSIQNNMIINVKNHLK